MEEKQQIIEEQHRVAELQLCIEEQEPQRHLEVDAVEAVEEVRVIRVENERCACVRLVANAITDASTTYYIPAEKQVCCMTVDGYSVQDTLTIGGDHHTPCRECLCNDPAECFWILTSVGMNFLGRQVRTGRQLQNNQVQHFLYKSFIWEEYKYLRDSRIDDEENLFEFCIGLP